jgi:hypothetical protein
MLRGTRADCSGTAWHSNIRASGLSTSSWRALRGSRCAGHAACAQVAVAREEVALQVDNSPLGGGVYECVAQLASEAPGMLLRVAFNLDAGLPLAVVAEPVRPV